MAKTTREMFNKLSAELKKIKAKHEVIGSNLNSIHERAQGLTREAQQMVKETSQVLEEIKAQGQLADDLENEVEWHADHQQSG